MIMEHWLKLIYHENNVDTIYFNFKKAFNTVPYQHLIAKIKQYHFSYCTINWVSFLTSRKQSSAGCP